MHPTYDFKFCFHLLQISCVNFYSSIVGGKFFGALLRGQARVFSIWTQGSIIREGACVILGWSSLCESGTPDLTWQFVLGDLQTDSASEHPPDNLKAWSQPVCYSDDYECGDWLMADDGNNDDDDDDDDRLMGCWWGIMRAGFEDRGCKIFVQPALLGCRRK